MMMMMVVVQRGRVPGGAAEPLPSVPLPLLLLHLLLFLGPIWAEGGRRAATPWASQAQPPPLHWQPETPPLKETASAEGKMEGSTTGSHSPTGLSYAVAASQILGLAVVTMMGAWMGHFRGGLAWDSPQLQFNVHPLCMTLGMVFLQADALLVFRVFRNESKRATKILHGLLHSLALVVALVGLVAVFQYHKKQNFPDLYSLHSWCGILAFSFYFLQWLVGLGFFLFPGASFSLRSWYKPQHAFLGAAIFLLSVATALLGILELLLFKIKDTYGSFAPEGVLANALGLLLAAFGAILGYILTREEWRRPLRGEEMALSMDFKTLTEEEPGERSPADPR